MHLLPVTQYSFGILILLLLLCKAYAYHPTLTLRVSGSEERVQQLKRVLEAPINKGSVKVKFEHVPGSIEHDNVLEVSTSRGSIVTSTKTVYVTDNYKEELSAFIIRELQSFAVEYVNEMENFDKTAASFNDLLNRQQPSFTVTTEELKQFLEKDENRFVLFYKSDGKITNSIAILSLDIATRTMDDVQIAAFDCSNDVSICKDYAIEDCPTIRFYKEGKFVAEMDDEIMLHLNEKILKNWMIGVQQPLLPLLEEKSVPYYRSGLVPGYGEPRDTVHMLFIASKRTKVYKEFKILAEEFRGVYPFAAMVHQDVAKWALNPAIITMKPLDTVMNAYTQYKDMSLEAMREYVVAASDPPIFDFNSCPSALSAFSRRLPLLVLYDPFCSAHSPTLLTLAADPDMEYRRTTARFGAINGTSPIALSLMFSWSITHLHTPQWILIDNTDNTVHTKRFANENEAQIKELIRSKQGMKQMEQASPMLIDTLRTVCYADQLRDLEVIYTTQIDNGLPTSLEEPPLAENTKDEL